MPKTDKPTGTQRVIKCFRCLFARQVVEVDEQVTAENDIEIPVLAYICRVLQVDAREFDRAAHIIVQLVTECCFGKIFLQI